MAENNSHLKIGSYNCRGYNASKVTYILQLLKQCEFLFIQEHWLSDSQLQTLNNICSTHSSHASSGFNNDDIISGRPFGGCAIFWRADIDAQVNFLPTKNRRICAIRVCNDTYKLLLINVYMPYESDTAAAEEFSSVMADLVAITEEFNDHCFIIGGDFNTDFSKHKVNSRLLQEVCNENDLRVATLHDSCSIDYTYNFNMTRFSFIDHFIVSTAVYESFFDGCCVRHDGDNLSDHDPIMLNLNIDWNLIATVPLHHSSKCRPIWHKANEHDLSMYKQSLQINLSSLQVPTDAIMCHDVLCNVKSHFDALNTYSNALIHACIDSASHTIPRTTLAGESHCNKVMPGWNEYVAPYRDKSILWHDIWVGCGRPRDGIVADIMRRTRASYHYAVRYVKKNNQDIIKDRFASAIIDNRNRDFWREAKKIGGNRSGTHSTVDGFSQSDDIANLFARQYEDLYSCVGYDVNEMASLQQDINDKISIDGYNEHCIITGNDVRAAVSRLKPGKHDGYMGLSSDHVKHACDEWFTHTSLLLTALTVHGCVTDDLSISTVLPIPKGKNLNYSDSTNYRGIALSSILGKIFDAYILTRYDNLLSSSNLQFGFKAGYSTSMCSMILKETLEHYRRNGSTVYCTMLDATKAFDRVEYCKLVRLLLVKKLPPVIIRLLLQLYLFSFTQVAWNDTISKRFRVSNGVRQGAILSPILFCVYFDVILGKLRCSGDGCYIGLFYVGALAYADDLVLLAPSASAMRTMLSICDDYATQFNVLFNANKSICLRCNPIGSVRNNSRLTCYPSFCIGLIGIKFVDKWPHLGHIITSDCDDSEDIAAKKASLIGQVNKIICSFRNVECCTKTKLVKSYCTSFYGAEIWDLSNSAIESINTSWRKGIRRVWQVPHTTHSALIPGLCDTIPLVDLFYKRMLNFVYRCLRSDSTLVNFIARHGIFYGEMDSIIGRNILSCSLRYNTNIEHIRNFEFHPSSIDKFVRTSDHNLHTAAMLVELLQCRDGTLQLSDDNFNRLDILAMIDIICTQ